MRSIINISLPSALEDVVNQEVKRKNFASKSEFFRHLLRTYMENGLAKELDKSRKELSHGNGRLLTSLKDLR